MQARKHLKPLSARGHASTPNARAHKHTSIQACQARDLAD